MSGRDPASGVAACDTACAAECKMVEVHGVKVASFSVAGLELLCLPQVFELFLKRLVGGLHTVYTKLKRLRIRPVVCSVEQVRVLRGLGAIQPGVNRCKLLTRADFQALYRDCTSASSRPGRPPKRTLGVTAMMDSSRLLPHGLISPALLSQTGVMVEALKLQRMRMMMGFHGNSDLQHNGVESENDNTGCSEGFWEKEQHLLCPSSSSAVAPPPLQQRTLLAHRLSDFPFMVMPHPLLPVGLMSRISHLSGLRNMAVVSHVQIEQSKESPPGSPSPSLSDNHREPTSQSPSRASSSSSSSPLDPEISERENNLKKVLKETADSLPRPLLKPTYEKLPLTSQPLSFNHGDHAFAPLLLAEGLSSMETLLTNIQGLLKMAVAHSRSQDKHNQLEKKALQEELERERDARQVLQRQLSSELQTRVSIQRRLKKEKKAKRKLQEALDFESRRREQVERVLTDVMPEREQQGNSEAEVYQNSTRLLRPEEEEDEKDEEEERMKRRRRGQKRN